jgi:hypothetical protein
MPVLSVHDLTVIAVDGFVGEEGAAVRSPIVRAPDGRVCVVRDTAAETFTPNVIVPEEEVRQRMEGGSWLSTPAWTAKPGHIVLVRSASFTRACELAGLFEDEIEWDEAARGFELAYVPRETAQQWRAATGERLVEAAEKELRAALHNPARTSGCTLEQIQELLGQALFVCDRGTALRRKLETRARVRQNRRGAVSHARREGGGAADTEADVDRRGARGAPHPSSRHHRQRAAKGRYPRARGRVGGARTRSNRRRPLRRGRRNI